MFKGIQWEFVFWDWGGLGRFGVSRGFCANSNPKIDQLQGPPTPNFPETAADTAKEIAMETRGAWGSARGTAAETARGTALGQLTESLGQQN